MRHAVLSHIVSLAALATFALTGCGGVADLRATHQVDLQLKRQGRPLRDQAFSVAMRNFEKEPFGPPKKAITDSDGHAQLEFHTMWNAAFFIIPPIGLVPSHPPKPAYSITASGREAIVSSTSANTSYHWQNSGWHTAAQVELP